MSAEKRKVSLRTNCLKIDSNTTIILGTNILNSKFYFHFQNIHSNIIRKIHTLLSIFLKSTQQIL